MISICVKTYILIETTWFLSCKNDILNPRLLLCTRYRLSIKHIFVKCNFAHEVYSIVQFESNRALGSVWMLKLRHGIRNSKSARSNSSVWMVREFASGNQPKFHTDFGIAAWPFPNPSSRPTNRLEIAHFDSFTRGEVFNSVAIQTKLRNRCSPQIPTTNSCTSKQKI
jgi:hypothetical protein